jgi:hypothetical protein
MITDGGGVLVAVAAGVVAVGAGVVAVGAGVVAVGAGVVTVGTGVSIGLVGWNATENDECPAEAGNTATILNTNKVAIRITRGAVFIGLQPPSTDSRGGCAG